MSDKASNPFTLDKAFALNIKMNPDDWNKLRYQAPGLDHFIHPNCESGPRPQNFSWFPCEATFDANKYKSVEIRKKGLAGSMEPTKPALKIKFGSNGNPGFRSMTLNNCKQDVSFVRQALAFHLFRKARLAAPRTGFVSVALNGKTIGLYTWIESIDKSFLAKQFGDDGDGELYELTFADFNDKQKNQIEGKSGDSDDRIIGKLSNAIRDANIDAIGKIVDLEYFYRFWAMEVIVSHWDGYSGNRNNSLFYRSSGNGNLYFIPWGLDQSFKPPRDWWSQFRGKPQLLPDAVYCHGDLCRTLFGDKRCRAKYKDALLLLLDDVWNANKLVKQIQQIKQTIVPFIDSGFEATVLNEQEVVLEYISKTKERVLAGCTDEKFVWDRPSAPALCGNIDLTLNGVVTLPWTTRTAPPTDGEGTVSLVSPEGTRHSRSIKGRAYHNPLPLKYASQPHEVSKNAPEHVHIELIVADINNSNIVLRIELPIDAVSSGKSLKLDFGEANTEFAVLDQNGERESAGRVVTGWVHLHVANSHTNRGLQFSVFAPLVRASHF